MMTGEGAELHAGSVQPGGRPPAPGELALVQAFINSFFDLEVEHGADLFATPAGLASWLSERGQLPTRTTLHPDDLTRALAVREGLRRLAAANNHAGAHTSVASAEDLNRAAAGAAVEIRFEDGRPRFVASGSGLDRALGVLLAITATAMLEGSWRRLKACPGDHCGWAFYDHSRNQSGRWCAMSVCGGRAKARTYYHRRRGEEGA
jgi:predicted RNA-binding Zn ribbon-like protein